MEKEIISIINTHADDDGWVDLSELGDNLPKRVPGFDPRNYKCTKLKQFIELFDSVEVRSARNPHNKILSIIYVRVKQKEEKPVFYYKDGSGDPGCPAEFDIEKVEIGGLNVTDSYNEKELERVSELALEKAIEIENERNDEFEARMMEADID